MTSEAGIVGVEIVKGYSEPRWLVIDRKRKKSGAGRWERKTTNKKTNVDKIMRRNRKRIKEINRGEERERWREAERRGQRKCEPNRDEDGELIEGEKRKIKKNE